MKRDSIEISVTTSFGFCKFKNTSAMRITFLLKMFKIESKFTNLTKDNRKMFLVSEIIASENIVSIKNRILIIGSQWFNKQS